MIGELCRGTVNKDERFVDVVEESEDELDSNTRGKEKFVLQPDRRRLLLSCLQPCCHVLEEVSDC